MRKNIIFVLLIFLVSCAYMEKRKIIKPSEGTIQLQKFSNVLNLFLNEDVASNNVFVYASLLTYFGEPDVKLRRVFRTKYIIYRNDSAKVKINMVSEPLCIVVYVFYWNRGGELTNNVDGFTGNILLHQKYDILLLQFVNDAKLISYLSICKR